MHLEKNRTYACTFPVQSKEINVVKVRFIMRYSSRKLSNGKVITTACNIWRQIACSFQVMSRNILILGKKNIWNPPIFSNPARGSGQKSSRILSTFFRPESPYAISLVRPKSGESGRENGVLGEYPGDVTAHGRVQEWPSRKRLGTWIFRTVYTATMSNIFHDIHRKVFSFS